MADVRWFNAIGKVSKETFIQITPKPDRNGNHILQRQDGSTFQVDHRRVIPPELTVECVGKALRINGKDKYRVVCPVDDCQQELSNDDTHAMCPTHGKFEIFNCNHGATVMSNQVAESKKFQPKPNTTPAIIVDEVFLAQYGEVWTKPVDFDHPMIAVRAFILLADAPARKFCINVYNGSIGKKSTDPAQELGLEDFKNGGLGVKGNALKHTIDIERTLLKKKGYKTV